MISIPPVSSFCPLLIPDMSQPVVRLAMWSGPRNISTAMMRSWGNRRDAVVCDEPLYAYFLKATGKPHPMADEIIAHHESDWQRVVEWLTGPLPEGRTLFYQKHMTHHLLPEIDRSWLMRVTNCFLIRDPAEMLTSYLRKMPDPVLEDTGYPQQVEIFDYVRSRTGTTPPVVDTRDFLQNPRRWLGLLCDALGLDFQESMLAWEPGFRDTDGIWASYWYTEVPTSTGFRPYVPKRESVPDEFRTLADQCQSLYQQLYQHRLR